MLKRLPVVVLVSMLAACGAAVPGYSPEPIKPQSKFAKALEGGQVAADGHYQLSGDEKAMDCRRMTGSMQITMARIKDSHARMEPSALSSSLHKSTPGMVGGSTIGADRSASYARERAKLDAYNRELAAKNCKTVDIDAELKRAPDAPGKKY